MKDCEGCMALWKHNGVRECLLGKGTRYIRKKDRSIVMVPTEKCMKPMTNLEYAIARKDVDDYY